MIKFKTFYCDLREPVDEIVNKWIKKNPDVEIVSYKYALGRSYNQFVSSICIMYKEK